MKAQAERDKAEAQLALTESEAGVNLSVIGEALYIDPSPLAANRTHNDSRVGIELTKRLYDFGQTAAREASSQSALESEEASLLAMQQAHRFNVMQRYLDVLLADHEYRFAVETVVLSYVARDKLRDRHELGQVSDIELLEAESNFARLDARRNAARARQRSTRALLGEALGYSTARPKTLVEPVIRERELPELDVLIEDVLAENPKLSATRLALESANQSVAASRAGRRPVITGKASTYDYQKDLGSRDDWQVGIALEWPLYAGGRVSAESAEAYAQFQQSQAEVAAMEMQLRERATELWERIKVLQTERKAALAQMDYRELYLDRSRALYEMEVATDLGDAMVESTRARLKQAEAEYGLLLAWAELDILQGRDPWNLGETQ